MLPPARRDLVRWAVLVAAGLLATLALVRTGAQVGTAGAPFIGAYRLKVDPGTALAPLVAAAVLLAAGPGWADRLRWPGLLAGAAVATVAWRLALALVDGGNGLADPVEDPREYLVDVPSVGDHPLRFVHDFVADSGAHSVATRQHPPAPVLLLWALGRIGLHRPAPLGVVLTLAGCASVPAVAVAVRSLCGEQAARTLLPVLVLSPWAVWAAVSMDTVTSALCATALAVGVVGSEPRRSPAWALTAGLLLGVAALFSYSAAWLGLSLVCVFFVRRRALLNGVAAFGALVPLGLARLAGFVWPDGLTAAQADFSLRVGPQRSWVAWVLLDLVVLVVAAGPGLVASARKVRRTPGWPFLVGAVLAVAFALGSGLSRGEVERSWLPFFPWLLVAAVAPERQGDDTTAPPGLLVTAGIGAATAVVLQSLLRTAW